MYEIIPMYTINNLSRIQNYSRSRIKPNLSVLSQLGDNGTNENTMHTD